MVNFRIVPHAHRSGVEIVEILIDGNVAAAIYPQGERQIKIISAHFQGAGDKGGVTPHIVISDHVGESMPIPDILMTFDPRLYMIGEGRLIRDKD